MKKAVVWLPLGLCLLLVIFFATTMQKNESGSKTFAQTDMPGLHLPDLFTGEFHDENSFKGEWSVVNVWASWCPPCLKEHPVLVDIAEKYNIPMYGVNFKDDMDSAKEWLRDRGNPYKLTLVDLTGRAAFDWGVVGVPETVLIDPQGKIRYRFAGIMTDDIWETQFLPLIEQE